MRPVIIAILIPICYSYQSLSDYKACQKKFNCSDQHLNPEDCPVRTFLDVNVGDGKCCHGCRRGIEWRFTGCNSTNVKRQCAPSLECVKNSYCALNRESCLHTMHIDKTLGWKPSCEIDGTYSPKQCRGDKITGRCFCYAKTGEKIFGHDWWKNADDMTCACSRQRFEAEQSGRLDTTLRCLPNGNYERLQCDMEICWCADEKTGSIELDTFAVPETLWTFLPCYNSSEHGDQYLRKCESAAQAQKLIQKKLINRGAINAVQNQIRCNYDGTYAEIIIENLFAFCQMPDGTKLNYASPSKLSSDMNCNCARDEKEFKRAGLNFDLRCKDNGNYEPVQEQNGQVFCVDRDGYAVSGYLKAHHEVDCSQFVYYEQEDIFEDN